MNFQDHLRILSGFVGGLRDPNPADIANVGYGLDEWTLHWFVHGTHT